MTTTAQNAHKCKKTHQSKWKWSGEDEEPDYSRWDDDKDTATLSADEQRYIRWYHASAHLEWRDDDVADIKSPHVPFMNLTKDQRAKKSTQFKFGLCSHCDAGLSDKSEFVCEPRPNDMFVLTCNRCHEYYTRVDYTYRLVDEAAW